MDLKQVQRLAQAFAQGVAFARGFTEMAQDAKDGEEDGHWVTIGGKRGADGEKHGGRPVFISGSGVVKKGFSKSAQGKTLGQVFGKGGEFSSEGKKSKGEADRRAEERTRAQRTESGTSTREPSVSRGVPKSFDLSTEEIHDIANELSDYTDDRIGSYEFGRKLLALADLNDEIDEMDKRYSSPRVQQNLEEARRHLGLAAKAARAVENYHWRGAIPSLRSEITRRLNKANKLYQEAQNAIDRAESAPAQEDPLYAARGKVINGPRAESAPARGAQTKEKTGTSTREPSSREVPKSFDLSTKEIKDLTDKLSDYTDDRIGSYEFGRKLLALADLNDEIDEMDKRYSSPRVQQNLEEARHHLGLAAREVRLMDNYQWRGAIPTLRSEITKRMTKANRLYQAAQSEIDAEQKRPW